MKRVLLLMSIIVLIIVASCKDDENSTPPDDTQDSDSLISLTILYTNDEHGWFEETEYYDGAAGLAGLWENEEGYDGSDNYLILSGGDMWTGAAASTWFEGESMVDVMNEMEYDAAAIGNHEFDFKVSGLNQRLSEMEFPLLAANIKEKSTGNIPSFAQAYTILNIDGIQVGILGLASRSTPYSTFPANVVDYEFTDYSEAINTYAPKAISEGAEVLILIGHICEDDLKSLTDVAKSNGISVMGGGHCHQVMAQKYNDIILIGGGDNMKGYAKVEFNYNVTQDITQDFDFDYTSNDQGVIDEDVKAVVDYWMDETNSALSEVIGYASDDIPKSSVEMWNMVCDSWFYTFPDADITITNAGGIRQEIFAGDITLATIVGLLPFENTIVELELTGAEVKDCISGLLIGGMTTVNGYFLSDGTPIDDETVYTVLTTDYLYSQTSINFAVYDDSPYLTAVHFRQPLIDWLRSINTTSADPLENYLDYTIRW
jgi:2',3'-cyclic-nucleotide 2'-phosphodiesterase (5'-nucleotidase family)